MSNIYYKLDENKNVLPSSIEEWCTFVVGTFPINYLSIKKNKVNGFVVSTIFFGVTMTFSIEDKPIVFETVVFDKDRKAIYQHQYSSYQEAKQGHKQAIGWVKNGCKHEDEINE